jgi:hypothetical protein
MRGNSCEWKKSETVRFFAFAAKDCHRVIFSSRESVLHRVRIKTGLMKSQLTTNTQHPRVCTGRRAKSDYR